MFSSVFLTVLSVLTLCNIGKAHHTDAVVCFYGSWSEYRPGDGNFTIEDIDPTLCTHAIYAFAKLDEATNTIQPADVYMDLPPSEGGVKNGYARFVNLKQGNADLKTMISIGGWNDGSEKYSRMVSNATSRATFVKSAVGFVEKYKFDGLDFDWEFPAERGGQPEDKENFALLISELSQEFRNRSFLLSAAIGSGSALDNSYNFPSLCADLDFLNLMLYDFYGPWDSFTAHHTGIYVHPNVPVERANSISSALAKYSSVGGCLEQTTFGMGVYGRTYTLANEGDWAIGAQASGPGAPGQFTNESGFIAYNEICLLTENYTIYQDEFTKAPWKVNSMNWISYDNPESIAYKSELAIEEHMYGAMVWAIDLDDFRNSCGQGRFPLLTAINMVLHAPVE